MSLTKEEVRSIVSAVNGALGLALEKLVKGSDPAIRTALVTAKESNQKEVVIGPSRFEYDEAQFEALYQKIKRRLIDECRVDPILLTLLTTSNAIEVQVEPRREMLAGTGLRARVARLMAAKFFVETRKTYPVRQELARTGADPGGGGNLAACLGDFVKDGFLVRDGDGYQIAPGVVVTEKVLEAR